MLTSKIELKLVAFKGLNQNWWVSKLELNFEGTLVSSNWWNQVNKGILVYLHFWLDQLSKFCLPSFIQRPTPLARQPNSDGGPDFL